MKHRKTWNTIVIFGRIFSPTIALLVLFQTPDTLADWDRRYWLFPLQIFALATNLQIAYVSWFRDRLR